ncbi:hypothetical protein DU002_08435 [Corallincola holothuriorum]|uniref:Uncharacterized protein n=1 Tax=Corallincola holothuriorum TaxID=2282215 RepID=A0A368NK15_9GAMM|nr:hypothetical protein DU002_08435 [Corallincola holothuriorum]
MLLLFLTFSMSSVLTAIAFEALLHFQSGKTSRCVVRGFRAATWWITISVLAMPLIVRRFYLEEVEVELFKGIYILYVVVILVYLFGRYFRKQTYVPPEE